MLKVLHISDCHLVVAGTDLLGVDTQQTLEWVLADALADGSPDAVIASGDLAHDPTPAVYERFLATIQSATDSPMLVTPGNHDVAELMLQAGLPFAGLALPDWGLVGLDSHEDELPRSLVTTQDKQTTQRDIEALCDATHLLLATHHHLLPVNCPWLDCDRVQMPQEVLKWAWQASAGRLRGCVFGHVHQAVEGVVTLDASDVPDETAQQMPVWGVPSTCFQFLPRSPTFAVDALGPGYRWLYLHPDGSVGTEVKRIQQSIEIDMSRFKH